MKSALFALALSPLLAAPAFAQSCVMGGQFVPCPGGAVMATPEGGAMMTGPLGLAGGVVGGALAVPGAVVGGTVGAFDPDATGSIAPAPRRAYGPAYRGPAYRGSTVVTEEDDF